VTAAKNELLLTKTNLNSHFAESYRALRANISFSSIDKPVKAILVTSAAPREGKTTTALNLGIMMAQAGASVVIVDADFRHPSLHRLLEMTPNGHKPVIGLSNVIVGKAALDDALLPTEFANLRLLPAGALPPNPSELLASKRIRAVLTDLTEQADYVLLDSPPCLLYADAYVLSQVTDGVLYVVRAGSQDKAAQRRVHKQLQQAKARVLGTVFNGVEVEETSSSYAYYYPSANGHRR
jgi:capsular exopolysaccharide synthesis family protein